MTVQRYRDGAWGEVNKVGKPLDDVSVNVRREGEWQEIWPSVDIPDSVVNQWAVENFATPWPDSVGTADMTINGLSSSTFSTSDPSVFGDGVDDFGSSDPTEMGSLESFGLAFTLAFENPDGGDVFFGRNESLAQSDTGSSILVRTSNVGDAASIEFFMQDENGNRLWVYTTSTFDDGTPKPVIIDKNGNTASDIDIYVDDMENPQITTTETDDGFNHTNYTNALDMYYWARNDEGSDSNHMEADMGVIEFNSDPYSQDERNGFVSRRPEV